MVGFAATVVGIVTLVVLVLMGVWLTWLGLRDDRHTPSALRPDETDEVD